MFDCPKGGWQPQLNSTELGLAQKWVCKQPPPPPPHPNQTQFPSQGASDQLLMFPKQQNQH